MKKILIFIILCTGMNAIAQDEFRNWFVEGTLRFDYLLAGNHTETSVFFTGMKKEPFWGGSHTQLVDTFRYGEFMLEISDAHTGKIIYSRGFSTLFNEWQTTAESKRIRRAFYQSALMPFPKKEIKLDLLKRNRKGSFELIYTQVIDPADMMILNETPAECDTSRILNSGDPARKLDIAFIAEGYTMEEKDKFIADATRFTDYLFSISPYDRLRDRINVWSVFVPSPEQGTDIPGENIYRHTPVNATDYTFGLSRYITTTDIRSLHDYAASVPSDQLILLVNSSRYGGGGIFNHYASVTSDHPLSMIVMVHEFGHSFAGLGDEYYTSEVAYEEFYALDVEPWEPNLTTLVDFESKWKDMLLPGTPVPTPAGPDYVNRTGVFEGGGYVAKGVYRPYPDCRMKSNIAPAFCPVCQRAIERMILFYSE